MIESNERPDTAGTGVKTAITLAIVGSIIALAVGLVLSFTFDKDAWLVTAIIMAFVGLRALRMIELERHHANQRENEIVNSRAAINRAEAAQIEAQATQARVQTQIAIRQYKQLPAGVSASNAPIATRQSSAWNLRVTINYGSTRQFVTLDGKFIEAYVRLLRDGFDGDYRRRLRDEGVSFENADVTLIKQLMREGGVYEGSTINREQLAALLELWRTTGVTQCDQRKEMTINL